MTPTQKVPWTDIGKWSCQWISIRDIPETWIRPIVAAYRCRFSLDEDTVIRVHVSADERYKLYLDGQFVGLGSERGDPLHWFYETYDFSLTAGEHVFVAIVWSLGQLAPYSQMSVYHGFFFAPEPPYVELMGTGIADWDARVIDAYTFVDPSPAWGTGANIVINGQLYPWGIESGIADNWQQTAKLEQGANILSNWDFLRPRVLCPATLPPMLRKPVKTARVRFIENLKGVSSLQTFARPINLKVHLAQESHDWQALFENEHPAIIPPHSMCRIIVDLDNYYCAYPEVLTTHGQGSTIQFFWAESLFEDDIRHGNTGLNTHPRKGNRDLIDGKFFFGVGDTFLPDGGEHRIFAPLWWQAGRYIEVLIQTQAQTLTIERVTLTETRYPLAMEGTFSASEARLEHLLPLLVRGIQMCSHETFVDCPYYEQLMYSGDTRLQVLTTYTMTRDDRLPRKAIQMFDYSRHWYGLMQARYPNRVTQIIGPFCLWWIGMVHDYAMWRDDIAFVKQSMAGVRATIEAYLQFANDDGLIAQVPGWQFMDWVPGWEAGMPPDAARGVSAVINWQFAWALMTSAKLERIVGQPLLALHREQQATNLANQLERFWSEQDGLYADDLTFSQFSEHAQILAILSEQLTPERQNRVATSLLRRSDLSRATVFFCHYLFETYQQIGVVEALFERLSLWFAFQENGLRTPIEVPEPTRSDCHGWGSHPLYHYFATLLGVRPASAGFSTVIIQPQLGKLTDAKGMIPHPKGVIQAEYHIWDGKFVGHIKLPAGITGTLRYRQHIIPLHGGANIIELEAKDVE